MYYIESPGNDPYFNLALEQYVFDCLDRSNQYFMLWQNDNAVIVGKHQNTIGEINTAYVAERNIRVVRRLSGGGAVYHDMGNINFTFIADYAGGDSFDFATFCKPVLKALASVGVRGEISGRNDMTIDGKKFSGNSQYMKQGRVMHHGTILYDSDLQVIGKALAVSRDKVESKGLKSVQSRVTNVRPYVAEDIGTKEFLERLRGFMFEEYGLRPYELTPSDLATVRRLQTEVYAQWSWNYGASPRYQIQKERRIEGCGKLEVYLDVEKGYIRKCKFYGDYFGNRESDELAALLQDCPAEADALRERLEGVPIGEFFNALDLETFISVLVR